MRYSPLHALLAHRSRITAARWVAAEVRHFEAARFVFYRPGEATLARHRRARKARARAIARGDLFADNLSRLHEAGLHELFSELLSACRDEIGRDRRHRSGSFSEEIPPAHPLGDPNRSRNVTLTA